MLFCKKLKLKRLLKKDLYNAFPFELHNDVKKVISVISKELFKDEHLEYNTKTRKYNFVLSNNFIIHVPYRLVLLDNPILELSETQKLIMHCIYSRSTYGFVREKHINEILKSELPFWTYPFIIKISDEYLIEILNNVYNSLKDKDNLLLKEFCACNKDYMKKSYQRMISYWDCYYRKTYPYIFDYVGKKLYSECFK